VDLTALTYENDFFDLIICNHVLEHIPDDKKAISEMYRALKKGGKAVITVPIDENLEKTYEDSNITSPADRLKHFGQWDHVRSYAKDIKQRFENEGFNTELIQYADHFSSEEFNRMGLRDDYIVVGTK
jgi:ubiquinone/menaquinone biosynthesis C-methylase UbiE